MKFLSRGLYVRVKRFNEPRGRIVPGSEGAQPHPYNRSMFTPLPSEPDSNALELEILDRWEREGTFEQLRDAEPRQRRSGRSSTGRSPRTRRSRVHTAWGRTLKDVFQRYKALRGFDQRYQNGFDCQGLWIEVGVERELGPQLEARDRGVRARGVRRAGAATSSSGRPRS